MSILSRAIDANRKTTSTGSKQTNKKEQEGRATTARPSLPTTSASSAIRSLTGGVAPKLPTAGPSRLEQAISASRRGETVRPQSWTDAESGFDSWLQEVNSFAQRMSQDYTKRSGKYQDAAAMSKYRSAADTTISQMENRSKSYRDFFSTRRDLYGDDTVDSILSALDEGDSYLEGLRKNLAGEADYWGQFADEDAYKGYQRMSSYAKIPEAEDFAEKSRYVSTYKPGTEKFNAWSGTYTDTGFGDIAYDYINRDEKARSRQLVNDVGTNAALLGLDNSERGEMTDEEIGIFNYLYATQGPDTAYQYITDITSELNARQRAASEQEWAQYANEHPVGSSVFSILESPLKGLSYLGQAADYLSDGKIDQNEGYNKFSYMNSAIRNEVSKLAEDKWGGVGSFAYQTGMSMGDFLFNTAITGGQEALSLAIMGTGAAADSTISAKDRGLSDDQAFAIGTIAGAAEVITEKFSLDALLNTDWEQGAIKYILKNAFVEGSEEVGSDVINLVADVLVAKDKSEWQTSIEAYKAQGYSDSEAFGKAVGDQAMEMGVDFLGGALSGGIMAGGGAAVNMGGTYLTGREFNSMDLSAEDIQAFIDEGLASPPSSQAYQLAQAAQQKIAAGGTLSNYELGNLYQANVRAIDAEDDGTTLLEQAARDAAEGKRLTNKAATTILDNPSAVEILARDAGLELTDDMTKAQRREAVKIAVNALARPATATSATTANTTTAEQGGAQTAQETRQETGPEVRQEVRQEQTAQPVQSVPLQAYNIRRLDQALSALGPQGQAQARAFYDSEGQSAYEYYSGFSAYYEAGISGTDMGKVRSQYASALNENQKQAAYLAGQADAAASLAAERERIPTATVYGSEAGFIPTEYSAHLPREQVRTLNSLGRALGIKLQIVAPTGADGANGWNANGSIGIASDAENPFLVVAYHEVTHRMQELAPEEYRRYRDIAMRIKGAKDGTQGLVEGYKSRYAKAGQNLSTEQAMDEIAADFTGDLLREVDGFRDLARTDRSVAGKLLDAIRDFIRRVKRVFSGNRAAQNRSAMDYYGVDMNTLEEAARLWEDALRASEQAAYLATEEGQRAELSDRDTKFSLKSPVEETEDLLALHNLTEDKLMKSIRLGGFPMPSIAVTRADIPHTNFGPISLVMRKETIDPEFDRRNTVYSADAWTPTFPQIEYEADEKAAGRIRKKFYDLYNKFGRQTVDALYGYGNYLEDELNRYGGVEGILARERDNVDMMKVYLADTGAEIPAEVTMETVTRLDDAKIEQLEHLADRVGREVFEEMRTREGETPIRARRRWMDEHGDALEDAYRSYLESFGMTPEQIENVLASETVGDMSRLALEVRNYLRNGPETRQTGVDTAASRQAIRDAVDQSAYEAWLEDLFSGAEKSSGIYNNRERYTSSGNQRSFKQTHYPVTLENIAKAMAGQNDGNSRNVSGFHGVKTLRAGTAKRFSSIAEMHELEGRLRHLTEEEAEKINDALGDRLSDVTRRIYNTKPHSKYDNEFIEMDTIGEIMMEVTDKKSYTTDTIRKVFSKYGYKLANPLAEDLRNLLFDISQMPVNIFEAKPERAVGFDEVLAAVIPDNASTALREGLQGAGVRMLEYKAGDEADRLRAVNSVEGARFSLKQDSKGRALTKAQQEYFKDSVIRDSQGRLMVMYHGTRNGGFTVFGGRKDYSYFTNSIKYAYTFEGRKQNGQYFPSTREDMEAGYAHPQRYEVYLNVKNPFIADQDTVEDALYWDRSLAQLLRDKGYDALMMEDMSQVVVLYPEQIKNVTNRNPTSDPDIRRSLKGTKDIEKQVAALQEENQLLRDRLTEYRNARREAARQKERADYWQGQTRRTKAITTDKKSVQRAARELVNGYGAELDVADVAAELQSLYDYIAQGGDDFSATEAQERAEALAQEIVENAVAVEDEVYRQYSDLRSYLRTTRLSIAPEDSSDIADYGDFRKRYFGRLRLVKGPTNIDQVYAELADMYPSFFDEQTHSVPSDQLLHIAEVLDKISEITEYNPFSYDARNATVGIANEIMEKFFDLPQTKATFADRQARKLEAAVGKERQKLQQLREQRDTRLAQLREENRERVQRAVQTERERAGKKMDALKERYAARDAAGRERRSARELRAKITRHAKQLSQRLLQPNDKQHIPEGLRGPVAAMLEAINLESQYSIDRSTGKRTKNGQGSPTKRTQAFLELKAQYAKIVQEGADMVIDPALLGDAASGFTGLFDEVIAMKDIRLADMSTAQLEKVWQTVRAVEHSVNKAGKILSASKFTRTQEWAASLQQDTETRRARKPLPTPRPLRNSSGGERKLATLDLETPYTYFSHYGDAGLAVYRMLRDAQDQQQVMVNQVAEEVGKIVTPKQVKDLNSKTHEFTTERGDKLTLTTAQVMEIYELTRRKQAHDHLMKGGIVQPQIGSANIQRGTDAILLTEGDLMEITKGLTAEQVKIADDLQKLTTGMLADMGNRASMAAYGYKKFTGTDYWPIKSAREGVHSNIETGGDNTRSIKNIGLAKSVVPHASNPLDIAGIFDTFAAHAADMTDYAAWLCPMEDVNRLFNFRFLDADGNQTGRTVKGLLDRVGGPGAQAYWSRLMEDIQNGISASSDSTLTNIFTKGIGSFKGAAVGGNIRVIIQQPTAFFRAGAVLSPQDMARGLARGATRGNGWQKALQYSPIAQRKDAGGFDISSPLKMSEMLYDNRTRVRKLNDALSAPAGMADAITWGRLWNACEWAVAREHKDLPRGSAVFYAEVNRLFTATIDQTQVVDGVLQRSQIMRSSNALAQQATAFMGEPIMSLNLAMRAYDQVRYEQDSKKRSRAIKALGRVTTALVVTNAVNALAQSLIDAMRDDDEDKKYWERFRSAFTGLTGEEESAWDKATAIVMGGNLGSGMNPIGQIPFVKDIQSLIEGYDVSRTDMEVFSDLISAAQTVMTSAGGNGKKTRAYGVKELFAAGAKMFGIPAANLARDTWGLARSIAVETDNIPLQYEMEKAIYNITNSGNKARYLDIAYRALETGDLDLYRHITQELQEKTAEGGDGVTGPAITSGMRSRYDKRKEADPGYTLPRAALDLINSRETYSAPKEDTDAGFSDKDLNAAQYRSYEDQRAKLYREYADTLQGYGSFSGLEPATKDKLLKAADDLAKSIALEENSGGQYEETTAWKSWAAGGAQYGVDEAEALLFKAAYDTIGGDKDEKTGKTIAGSKKENVLEAVDEMMPWLTDEELSYLMSAYWKQK